MLFFTYFEYKASEGLTDRRAGCKASSQVSVTANGFNEWENNRSWIEVRLLHKIITEGTRRGKKGLTGKARKVQS